MRIMCIATLTKRYPVILTNKFLRGALACAALPIVIIIWFGLAFDKKNASIDDDLTF